MEVKDLIRQHALKINIMQLATSADDQPYLCTVHYYADDDLNFYWSSKPDRRHSQEIAQNSKVAAYVLVHENTPDEAYVIGMTIIGEAKLVDSDIDKAAVEGYAKKHGTSSSFVANIMNDEGNDKFYHLKPSKIILFDTKNISGNPRQEIDL